VTEPSLHAWLTAGLFLLAVVTAAALTRVSAPYGRHVRDGWGPALPSRWAWMLMESPAVLAFALVYAAGRQRAELVPLALLALWQLHYLHRTFVYPLLTPSGRPWPLVVVGLGFAFQCYNSYLNARHLSELGSYPDSWLGDARFLVGVTVFGLGLLLNRRSDAILRRLRAPGETGYRIPRGGGFELVSCPNYLGEILEWCGWALATWSWPGLAFALYTIANLAPRAVTHHRWYRETFPDYPPERRALVPYLL